MFTVAGRRVTAVTGTKGRGSRVAGGLGAVGKKGVEIGENKSRAAYGCEVIKNNGYYAFGRSRAGKYGAAHVLSPLPPSHVSRVS